MGEVKHIEGMIVPSHLSQLFQTMENMGGEGKYLDLSQEDLEFRAHAEVEKLLRRARGLRQHQQRSGSQASS